MRSNFVDRAIPVLWATAGVLAVSAVAAGGANAAATVALSGGFKKTLTYSAAPSERTTVLFAQPGYPADPTVTIATSGNTMIDGDGAWGCTVNTPRSAACPGDWLHQIRINGSNQGDTVVMWPTVQSGSTAIYGKGGNDFIVGASTGDVLNGGPDNDTIYGDATGVSGFPQGNDRIIGGSGADTIDGLGGTDSVDYGDHASAVNVSLETGTGGNASEDGTLDTIHGVENIYGTNNASGFDWLEGDDGPNSINGGKGTDILVGNGGVDWLFGDEGPIDIMLGGAQTDYLIGGLGDDYLFGGPDADFLFDAFWGGITGGGTNHFYGNDDGAVNAIDQIFCNSGFEDIVFAGVGDAILNESACSSVTQP